MGKRNGSLLWNRMRLELPAGLNDVDTGIVPVGQAFPSGQPTLGPTGVVAPADGALPVSALQVIPLPPLDGWALVSVNGEPYFHTGTRTMHVELQVGGKGATTVNVWFKLPTTLEGPGEADTYNVAP